MLAKLTLTLLLTGLAESNIDIGMGGGSTPLPRPSFNNVHFRTTM